jgi:hypothetical protein
MVLPVGNASPLATKVSTALANVFTLGGQVHLPVVRSCF